MNRSLSLILVALLTVATPGLAQTSDPDVSKLGLVRIVYEGRCNIHASYVNGTVRITADIRRV